VKPNILILKKKPTKSWLLKDAEDFIKN